MPEIKPEEMPPVDESTIVCSFCGHQDGIEGDNTIIIVGTMGANICETCVKTCVAALVQTKQSMEDTTQENGEN